MHTMKRPLTWIVLLTLGVSIIAIASCSRTPVVRPDKTGAPPLPKEPWDGLINSCRYNEDIRNQDWTRIRTGLDTLSRHFSKPDVIKKVRDLSSENRKFLEKEVHLSDAEI